MSTDRPRIAALVDFVRAVDFARLPADVQTGARGLTLDTLAARLGRADPAIGYAPT